MIFFFEKIEYKIKKAIMFAVTLLMILPMLAAFCACDNENGTASGTARIIVDGDTIIDLIVELDSIDGSAKLLPVLKTLKEQGKLELEYEESATGAYLTKIGTIANNGNEYTYVYTSLESDKDVSSWASTINYAGVTLYSSGLGVSEMTLKDDTMIYFKTITF